MCSVKTSVWICHLNPVPRVGARVPSDFQNAGLPAVCLEPACLGAVGLGAPSRHLSVREASDAKLELTKKPNSCLRAGTRGRAERAALEVYMKNTQDGAPPAVPHHARREVICDVKIGCGLWGRGGAPS